MSDDVTRLAKFLGMMGSDHDGEVLNAARMAERHRRTLNKSWLALLSSSGGGSSETDYLRARASRAERMVLTLEHRVTELERELSAMRASRASTSASSTRRPSTSTGKYDLPRPIEDNLTDALLASSRTSDEIYRLTGWPRAHLRVVLGRIAKRRGLSLECRSRFGDMLYRFLPLA